MKKLREIKDDFIESLPNDFMAKSKNIMTKSVLSMLALSISTGAMASTVETLQNANQSIDVNASITQSIDDTFNNTLDTNTIYPKGAQSGIQIENPEHLYEINEHNLKYMVGNQVSGVYANPFVEGEVVTYLFENDPRGEEAAVEAIKDQLTDLGLDYQGFLSEYRSSEVYDSSKIFGGKPTSHHIQMSHEKFDDTNFVKMHVIDRENKDDRFYSDILYTMYHEAGHTIGKEVKVDPQQDLTWSEKLFGLEDAHTELTGEGQQMSIWGVMTDHAAVVKAESQAFIAGHLNNYKMISNAGMDAEAAFETFLADGFDSSTHLLKEGSKDPHLYTPAEKVLMKLFEENPEKVLAMSGQDIKDFSNKMSVDSVTFNFYPEVERSLERNAFNFVNNLEKELFSENEIFHTVNKDKFLEKKIKQAEAAYNSLDLESLSFQEGKFVSDVYPLYQLIKEDPTLFDNPQKLADKNIDNFVKNELDGEKKIMLVDTDKKHLMGTVQLESFVEHVEQSSYFKHHIGEVQSNTEWRTQEFKVEKQTHYYDEPEELASAEPISNDLNSDENFYEMGLSELSDKENNKKATFEVETDEELKALNDLKNETSSYSKNDNKKENKNSKKLKNT